MLSDGMGRLALCGVWSDVCVCGMWTAMDRCCCVSCCLFDVFLRSIPRRTLIFYCSCAYAISALCLLFSLCGVGSVCCAYGCGSVLVVCAVCVCALCL